jgi:gas vesicle protein
MGSKHNHKEVTTMRYEQNDNGENVGWSAFLAGAFIGAGVALLFAPQAGSELRGMLRNYAADAKDELVERGQEAWDTAVDRGKEYYDKGQETLHEAGRAAKEFAKQGQDKIAEVGKEAKEFAKQGKDKMAEVGKEATHSRG